MKHSSFTVYIEQDADGIFIGSIPLIPSCYAQGDTIDEAVLEITAVAQSLIELYKEEGLKIPLKLQKEKDVANRFNIPVIVAV